MNDYGPKDPVTGLPELLAKWVKYLRRYEDGNPLGAISVTDLVRAKELADEELKRRVGKKD